MAGLPFREDWSTSTIAKLVFGKRFAAAAIHPLVQNSQQIIQDGAVGIEQLVEKCELRLGQHSLRDGCNCSFAKLHEIDGAEHFVRFRETREQVLEIPPVNRRRECTDQRGFGRPRRSE